MFSFLFVSLANHIGFAQPFGIAEGTPTDKLMVLKELAPFAYFITPKNSHPDIESYSVISTPEHGVCAVLGYGFTLNNDAYGTRVRDVFKKITGQLSDKYGNSKSYDFLNFGSIWNDPKYWAMSLHKNERHYSRFWDKEEKSTLQNGIESIALSANSLGSDSTYIVIRFEYDNIAKCRAKMESVGSGAL
jgi:hypothetical protein